MLMSPLEAYALRVGGYPDAGRKSLRISSWVTFQGSRLLRPAQRQTWIGRIRRAIILVFSISTRSPQVRPGVMMTVRVLSP